MRLRAIPGALIALAIALVWVGASAASPQDVLADYRADGSIDGSYSVEDLRAALTQAQDTSLYGAFRDAVQAALNEQLGGFQSSGGSGSPPAAAPPAPRPQATQPRAPSSGGGGSGGGSAGGDTTGGGEVTSQQDRGGVAGATETGRTEDAGGGETGGEATPTAPQLVPRSRDAGASQAAEDTADATARDISGLSAGRELPQPPSVTPGEGVPLVFLALSAAAGALLLGGVGSAVYRRVAVRRSK